MINAVVVDDHPAVRAGIEAVLRAEPGFRPVAACGTLAEGVHAIERLRPEIAIVDYELGDGHGLELCLRMAGGPTKTLVYSAYSERVLVAAAMLAGADGVLHKSASADELCDAVRIVSRGLRFFPPVGRDVLEVCAARLDTEDLPILGMVVEGTPRDEIAEVLRLDEPELDRRFDSIVARLRPATGALRRLPGVS
jgi:DNA-binding NarL/FixJ family response regulator